jgi:hypothetical protein
VRASLRACVRDRDERRQNIRTHPKKHAAVCAIRSAPSPPSSSYPPHVPRSFGFGTRHAQHNTQHVHTQKHNENTCQREKHMPCFLFPFTERKPGGTRPRTIEAVSHTASSHLFQLLRRRGASTHRLCRIGAAGRCQRELGRPEAQSEQENPIRGKGPVPYIFPADPSVLYLLYPYFEAS